jgi:hypothetical protein
MSDYLSNPISISLSLNGGKGQGPPSGESQNTAPVIRSQSGESIGPIRNGPYSPICVLNEDVLLNIFDAYRLADPDEYEDKNGQRRIYWCRQRWWYKLARVCRLWRNLILASPSRLDLHLFCTYGVHVADMLAHSPPLPLAIYYHCDQVGCKLTAEDESSILLALSHRSRVRRISFIFPTSKLNKFAMAMDGQYPILERFFIDPLIKLQDSDVVFPLAFQAPNLRHFALQLAAFPPIGSHSPTTTAGIVTLKLTKTPQSGYSRPSYLLTGLSNMHHLEMLEVEYSYPFPHSDMERDVAHTPNMTLANLRSFVFLGPTAYLEGLVSRISAPSLSILKAYLRDSLIDTFFSSHLLRFMQTSENFSFDAVKLVFSFNSGSLNFEAISSRNITLLQLQTGPGTLLFQVTSALQIIGPFSSLLSVVEHVMLGYKQIHWYPDPPNEVYRTQWRELLELFDNAKTLCVRDRLVTEISRSLQSDDGERPLMVLPNLQKLRCSGGSDARDAFAAFIDERQVAGHPVKLTMVDNSVFFRPKWM